MRANLMTGQWGGHELTAFDYHFQTKNTQGRSSGDSRRSVVVVGSEFPLRPLFIRPEGLLDKFIQSIGGDDIDFESAEFSRKFYVIGPDKRWAYDVLHPRTMAFLMEHPHFTIEFHVNYIALHGQGRFSVAQFQEAAEVGSGILHRVPGHLVDQMKGGH